MPLATALRSVAEANQKKWPLQIYILFNDFSEGLRRRVVDSLPKHSCCIRWMPVDLSPFTAFSTLPHISSTTYARFLIPMILPEEISRALYLDADVLVLEDLGPLCDLDLDGATVGAVLDERVTAHLQTGSTTLAGFPLPRVQSYFNAGVLLIDVPRWRRERVAEKAVGYLNRCPHSLYSDQDALNFACDGAWKRLDCRWNYFQIDLKKPLADLNQDEHPGIVHFQGGSKPWDPRTLNLNAAFYDVFRTRTSFPRTTRERLTNGPHIAWARLKTTLRRTPFVNQLWNRLRRLRSPKPPQMARRVSL